MGGARRRGCRAALNPSVWDCGRVCAGLGAAQDDRGGALASKIGRETHFALRFAFRLNGDPEDGGDGPALGLPGALSSFLPLARRRVQPLGLFPLFLSACATRKQGREKIHRCAQRALGGRRMVSPALLRRMGRGSRRGKNDLNFIDYFASKRLRGGRGREFFGVFPIFFFKKYCKNFISPYNLDLSRMTKGLARQAQARRFAAWQERKKRDAVSSKKVLTKTKSEIRIRFFATQRARSSVGSECLATNQKVGGSNPSGRTTILRPANGWLAVASNFRFSAIRDATIV